MLYPLLSFLPVGILATLLKVWRWWEESRGLRVVGREKLLRAPGELARRNKEELDDRILDTMVWILGFPLVVVVCYLSFTRKTAAPPSMFWGFALLLALAVYGRWLLRLLNLLEERADRRLGLNGEQAVGEELNRLMTEGCWVFHDLPLDQKEKIDHVVVGPAGVFAVQTRTRRKTEAERKKKSHEVVYDGRTLQFPNCSEKEGIIQARNEARSLSQLLGGAVGASVPVRPVLALPGWTVISKGSPGDVAVVNPKTLRSAIITEAAPILTLHDIKQIAQQLDQKCRDVEF